MYHILSEVNLVLGKQTITRSDSMQLSDYFNLFILLPYFDLPATDMLYLVCDDIQCSMEELAEVCSYFF